MSVDYFLHCKDKQEVVKAYLTEIIHIYQDLIETAETQTTQDGYNKVEDINLFTIIKETYLEDLNETNAFCKALEKISQKICQHNYIIDLIDITPDRSSQIEYCQTCGHTKE